MAASGVQILTVCIAIGLLQSLGSSFGKILSSVGQLVCTMVDQRHLVKAAA